MIVSLETAHPASFRLGQMIIAHPEGLVVRTRGVATLLTMRVKTSTWKKTSSEERACARQDLILRSALARVSKDDAAVQEMG